MNVQLRLDTLRRRDRQQTLRHTRRESRQSCAWARDFTLCISKEALVLVEGDKSYTITIISVFSDPEIYFGPPPLLHVSGASERERDRDREMVLRTYASLGGVSNDQRRTSCVPLFSEWRPRELLAVGQAPVELCSCFRDCEEKRQLEVRLRLLALALYSPLLMVPLPVSDCHRHSTRRIRRPFPFKVFPSFVLVHGLRTFGRICDRCCTHC